MLVGVLVEQCSCGYGGVSIPNIVDLHEKLERAILGSPQSLNAEEVRFLRKRAEWSIEDLAAQLGIETGFVESWEGGSQQIIPTYDLLLRFVVARRSDLQSEIAAEIPNLVGAVEHSVQASYASKSWESKMLACSA